MVSLNSTGQERKGAAEEGLEKATKVDLGSVAHLLC